MAAPTDSGHALGATEDAKAADIDEVKQHAVQEAGEGGDAAPGEEHVAGAGTDDRGEEQVAKKPRVEKAENGGGAVKASVDSFGGESVKSAVEPEEAVAEGEVERQEETDRQEENGADKPDAGDGVSAKNAAPGDGGLRNLLQESENPPKATVASHGADAAHMLNGAK